MQRRGGILFIQVLSRRPTLTICKIYRRDVCICRCTVFVYTAPARARRRLRWDFEAKQSQPHLRTQHGNLQTTAVRVSKAPNIPIRTSNEQVGLIGDFQLPYYLA